MVPTLEITLLFWNLPVRLLVRPILLNSFDFFFFFFNIVFILLAHSTFYFNRYHLCILTMLNLIFMAHLNSHENALSHLINTDCIVRDQFYTLSSFCPLLPWHLVPEDRCSSPALSLFTCEGSKSFDL